MGKKKKGEAESIRLPYIVVVLRFPFQIVRYIVILAWQREHCYERGAVKDVDRTMIDADIVCG